jgi:predicted RNA binding protein YcfA (HicA-like mRNA interferase family)
VTQKGKLVERFLANPTSIRLAQIIIVLEQFGFQQIQAKGSHLKFKHPKLNTDLVIPAHNNDCKDFYKKMAKQYVERVI